MAIAFRSIASTAYGSTTNTTVSKPTGTVNDDIMVMAFFAGIGTSNPPDISFTPPASWTQIGTTTSVIQTGGGFCAKFWVGWKRAASEGASYAFTHTALSTQAVIASYSGCIASGDPTDVVSQNSSTTVLGTATGTGVTTTVAATKLLYLQHNWDGTGTLSPPSGMTERFDSLTYAADEDRASAGATSNRTQTLAGGGPWQVYLVALKPVAGAAGRAKVWSGSAWVVKPTKVWSGSAWVAKPAKVWNGSAWV